MFKSIVLGVVLAAMLCTMCIDTVLADGGDDLVSMLVGVRDTSISIGKKMDKFYARFCKSGFLSFTRGTGDAPSYCTVGTARAFVGGQLNSAGTDYSLPRGWTTDEFIAFVNWVAVQ